MLAMMTPLSRRVACAKGSSMVGQAPLSTMAAQTAFSVRGGAGPLDVDLTAKFATIATGLFQVLILLSPQTTIKVYGGNLTPMNELLMDGIGANWTTVAVAAYCLLFQETNVNIACGIGSLCWIFQILKHLLAGKPQELGYPAASQYVNLAIGSLLSFTLLTEASYAKTYLKIHASWLVLNGVLLNFMPESFGKAWGIPCDDSALIFLGAYGNTVLSSGIFFGCLAVGVETAVALGYAFIPSLLLCIANITKDTKHLGQPKIPQFTLMAILFVLIGTLAVPSGGKVPLAASVKD